MSTPTKEFIKEESVKTVEEKDMTEINFKWAIRRGIEDIGHSKMALIIKDVLRDEDLMALRMHLEDE